jgi:hypothetical protein
MLIIHGSKQEVRAIGIVAEFCPICREILPFVAFTIDESAHVYFVTAGTNRSIAVKCCQCDSVLRGPRDAYPAALQDPESLEEIIEETNPTIFSDRAARLALEDRVAAGHAIGPDDRIRLIAEPMTALEPEVRLGVKGSFAEDLREGLAYASGVGVAVSILLALAPTPMWLKVACIVSTAVLSCAFAGTTIGQYRRWAKKYALPRIGQSLTPLRPTQQEVARALKEMRRAKRASAKWYRTSELLRAIDDDLACELV